MKSMSSFEDLPLHLKESAYSVGTEYAWPRDMALEVIDALTRNRLLVLGIEIWLPTKEGARLPSPYIYSWDSEEKKISEPWNHLVVRNNKLLKEHVEKFSWDESDLYFSSTEPYFNINFCSEDEYAHLEMQGNSRDS